MKVETAWNIIRFTAESKEENELIRIFYKAIFNQCDCDVNNYKEFYELIIQTYY